MYLPVKAQAYFLSFKDNNSWTLLDKNVQFFKEKKAAPFFPYPNP